MWTAEGMPAALSHPMNGALPALKRMAASGRCFIAWRTERPVWLKVSSERFFTAGRWTSSMPEVRLDRRVGVTAVDRHPVPALDQTTSDLLDGGLEAAVCRGDAPRADHRDVQRLGLSPPPSPRRIRCRTWSSVGAFGPSDGAHGAQHDHEIAGDGPVLHVGEVETLGLRRTTGRCGRRPARARSCRVDVIRRPHATWSYCATSAGSERARADQAHLASSTLSSCGSSSSE